MRFEIDRNSAVSAYQQLYEALRGQIVAGLLAPGEKLPSKRQLAEDAGVSVITAEHAYALLADEGYITARPRSGFYVDPGVQRQRGSAPEPVLPPEPLPALTEADTDFPFSVLAKTMRRVLTEYDSRILVKAPPCGVPELRNAIAGYLSRSRGIAVRPEQIVVGSGAEYLYSLAVQLLGREREYALEDPCYDKIRRVYEANGARCTALPLAQDGIAAGALRACRAGVLHVTPYNSFPSGITASGPKRREYAAWAEENGSYIVEDDYDAEFATRAKQIETICSVAPERVLYVNSFTRTMAPSFRMAYMVLPEPLVESYRERLGFYSCTVPVFEQYVLAEFIGSGELERCINRRRRRLRRQGK